MYCEKFQHTSRKSHSPPHTSIGDSVLPKIASMGGDPSAFIASMGVYPNFRVPFLGYLICFNGTALTKLGLQVMFEYVSSNVGVP